jgi:hypothetical protein
VVTERIVAANDAEFGRCEVRLRRPRAQKVVTERIVAANNAEHRRCEVQVVGVGPHDN